MLNEIEKMDGKKKNKFKIVIKLSFYLLILLILFIGGFFAQKSINLLSKISSTQTEIDKDNLNINKETYEKYMNENEGKILTIAAFGLDRRTVNETPRSDAIMLITIDSSRKKIKLTSILRDLYVKIPGIGNDKLNHAYFYGGAPLSIKTLNSTFDLSIEDYISVDFFNLPKIIDDLGGIEIDIKKEEIQNLNKYIKENQILLGVSEDHTIKKEGPQILSGIQALSYARIRSVGDGDFERTDRQRKVLLAMIRKATSMSPINLMSLVEKHVESIETSLSTKELISIGANIFLGDYEIEQIRLPLEQDSYGKFINDVWYLDFNKEKTLKNIHNYIFEDILP